MKKVASVLVIAILAFSTFSQQPIGNRTNQFNAGVGLSNYGLPVYIGIDHGLPKNFSVGGELTFRQYYYYSPSRLPYGYREGALGVYGNLNYHFNELLNMPSDWNFYAGLNAGCSVFFSDFYTASTGLGIGGQIGGRYFITDRFGLNLEVGGGRYFSGGKFGITLLL